MLRRKFIIQNQGYYDTLFITWDFNRKNIKVMLNKSTIAEFESFDRLKEFQKIELEDSYKIKLRLLKDDYFFVDFEIFVDEFEISFNSEKELKKVNRLFWALITVAIITSLMGLVGELTTFGYLPRNGQGYLFIAVGLVYFIFAYILKNKLSKTIIWLLVFIHFGDFVFSIFNFRTSTSSNLGIKIIYLYLIYAAITSIYKLTNRNKKLHAT